MGEGLLPVLLVGLRELCVPTLTHRQIAPVPSQKQNTVSVKEPL